MTKSIAIIGSGGLASIIANEAKKMNINSYSFSNSESDKVIGHSSEHYIIDIFDIEKIIQVCEDLNIQGIVATTELTVDVAAKIANQLNLNGLPVSISSKITDKSFVRNKVKKLESVKQPEYTVFDLKNPKQVPKIQNYPVIVKPTSLGGKRGVSIAESEKELQSALNYSEEYLPRSESKIIIEEYLSDGIEYSVETLSYKSNHTVVQVTEKITSGAPHFVELGHMQPANISSETRKKIEKVIPELLTIVGVDNSAAHIEIKIIDGEVYLIELNARPGGDHISSPLIQLSTGYSYIQGLINIAIDTFLKPDTDKFHNFYSGVIFVTSQTTEFKEIFDKGEQYPWLHKKNFVSNDLEEIINNKAFDINYLIYKSKIGVPKEIQDLL